MRQVIVESLGGYEAARQYLRKESVMWRTTSPGLLELLKNRGEDVRSLEEGVSVVEQNQVGNAAYEFASAAVTYLDDNYPIYGHKLMGLIFGEAIAKLSFVLMYKALLLDRVLLESPDGVFCVGRPVEPDLKGLDLNVGRFDTLFAMLLTRTGADGVEILDYFDDPVSLRSLDNWAKNRPMNIYEKTLSMFSNTPGSFAFKIWRKFQAKIALDKLRLVRKPRACFFVYKDCELIQESFLPFLLRGAEFSRLSDIRSLSHNSAEKFDISISAHAVKEIESLGIETLKNCNFPLETTLPAACNVIATRVLTAAKRLQISLPRLEANFEGLVSDVKENDFIITNYFSQPEERLFGLWCRKRGLNVVSFEHGITRGLSGWSKYSARFSGMLIADVGVYHWEKSVVDMKPWLKGQRVILGGIPKTTAQVPMRPVQRFLVRKWLKLPTRKKIVMYVAGIERNNMIYGPYSENDLQYKVTTEAIVEALLRYHSDAMVLLKLYPTHRYPQACTFEGLQSRNSRLRIIKDMDFRFIRAAADLIAISSNQSTLGWALGAGCPVWMFEKEAAPVMLSGKDLKIPVSGISRVLELDGEIVMDTGGSVESILDGF